jgi:BirA family biotin operon repressor/biotin-[acetyl-CoA-carboxylase] ligase
MPAAAARLAIKWPNDVLLDRRKLAGVLCEGRDGRLVVGIGLNRAADLPVELRAASLHQLGDPPAVEDLLARIRSYLLEGLGLYAARGLEPLLPQVRARDALLGRSLTVMVRGGWLEGVGGGIDEAGRLLVVVPGGGIAAIDAGHIEAWA